MSHDTWIHRIARACVRPLVNSAVTPNHLTLARLASGVISAGLIATAAPGWVALGCGLYLLSMLLDRADGELARLSGRTSAYGHRLDLWADGICDTVVVLALGFAQRDGFFAHWAPVMGLVAAASVALIFRFVLAADRQLGAGSVMFQATAGFDPDDAIALVPLSVLFGFGDWTLAAATIVTPVVAMAAIWHLRRVLAKAAQADPECRSRDSTMAQ